MDEKLKRAVDEFIDEFKNHKTVKQYLILKKKLSEDETFLTLKQRKKDLQKELALSINKDNYQCIKDEFIKANEEYENYPLYINYMSYLGEVKTLLQEIELYLK